MDADRAVGVLPDQRDVITEGDAPSDCQGTGIMSDCGQAAEQTAPRSSTGTLLGLTHSSFNAVTRSCVPESSLLELGAPELRMPGGPGHTAAHEPMIIFGTYLASPAAHAHSAPCATACDTISPRPRTR